MSAICPLLIVFIRHFTNISYSWVIATTQVTSDLVWPGVVLYALGNSVNVSRNTILSAHYESNCIELKLRYFFPTHIKFLLSKLWNYREIIFCSIRVRVHVMIKTFTTIVELTKLNSRMHSHTIVQDFIRVKSLTGRNDNILHLKN